MRRNTGPDPETVQNVLARDHHSCRTCAMGIYGDRGINWVLHHRRPRGSGGSRRADTNSPSNLVVLCAHCHAAVEGNRTDALAAGWLVSQWDDPARVPVRAAGLTTDFLDAQWIYLLPGGTESTTEPHGFDPVPVGRLWHLDADRVSRFREERPHVLAESAERADEDMAALAVDLYPGDAA